MGVAQQERTASAPSGDDAIAVQLVRHPVGWWLRDPALLLLIARNCFIGHDTGLNTMFVVQVACRFWINFSYEYTNRLSTLPGVKQSERETDTFHFI